MKLKYYTTGILLLAYLCVSAKGIPADTASNAAAPDTSSGKYNHMMKDVYMGLGFVLGGSNSGATINYGESREFVVGIGYGYKLTQWNGVGIDVYYKSTGFYLKQDSTKILTDNVLHNSEKISFDNFGGQVYDRFIFGSLFIDGGLYFDWAFYTKHITWDNHTVANSSGGSSTKSIDKQLVFANSTNYGLMFRLGKATGTSLYFSYRLSDVFKKASGAVTAPPELPVYVLGLTIGMHD